VPEAVEGVIGGRALRAGAGWIAIQAGGQIQKQGYEPLTLSPEEWTRSMLAEYAMARAAAEAAGIKAE